AVRDALRSGRSVVSGGLYMTVTGPNGEAPGAKLPPGNGTAQFKVTIGAPSWLDFDPNVEVIVDGKTVTTVPLVNKAATIDVDRTNKHWVIFHVKAKTDL